MSWTKWNDWNTLAKAAKNIAENAQKRIDKVLDIPVEERNVDGGDTQANIDGSVVSETLKNDVNISRRLQEHVPSSMTNFEHATNLTTTENLASSDYVSLENDNSNDTESSLKYIPEQTQVDSPSIASIEADDVDAAMQSVVERPIFADADASTSGTSTETLISLNENFNSNDTAIPAIEADARDDITENTSDCLELSALSITDASSSSSNNKTSSVVDDTNAPSNVLDNLNATVFDVSEVKNIESKHATPSLNGPMADDIADEADMPSDLTYSDAAPPKNNHAEPTFVQHIFRQTVVVTDGGVATSNNAPTKLSSSLLNELNLAKQAVIDSQSVMAETKVRLVQVESKLDDIENENRQLVHLYRQLEAEHSQCSNQNHQQIQNNSMNKHLLDEQMLLVTQLRQEGTKLSDENFRLQQLLKKLRSKTKEHETSSETFKSTIDEQHAQIDSLQQQLNELKSEDKRSKTELTGLRASLSKQEKLYSSVQSELQESKARNGSLQTALENAFENIAVLEREHSEQKNKAQETLLSGERAQQNELRRQLDDARMTLARQKESFDEHILQSHGKCQRSERELMLVREKHQQELNEYQRRIEQAETYREELQQSTVTTLQPYLQQIDELQRQLSSAKSAAVATVTVASSSSAQQRDSNKLQLAQRELNEAHQRESKLIERCAELEQRVSESSRNVQKQQNDIAQSLQLQLVEKNAEFERLRIELLDIKNTKTNSDAEHQRAVVQLERQLQIFQQQAPQPHLLNGHASSVVNSDKNNNFDFVAAAHYADDPQQQQQHHKQIQPSQQQQKRSNSGSTVAAAMTPVPLSTSASVAHWLFSSPDPSFIDGWSAATAAVPTNNNNNNNNDMNSSSSSVLMRSLTTMGGARQLSTLPDSNNNIAPSVIMQYRSEIDRLKASNERLMRELASTSSFAIECKEVAAKYSELEQSFVHLRAQNETLMQMYGERVEEVSETKQDLMESRDAYKQQLELLTSQIEQLQQQQQQQHRQTTKKQ